MAGGHTQGAAATAGHAGEALAPREVEDGDAIRPLGLGVSRSAGMDRAEDRQGGSRRAPRSKGLTPRK